MTRLLISTFGVLAIALLLFFAGCSKEKDLDDMTIGEIKEQIKDTGQDIKEVSQEIKDKICPLCDAKECPESDCPEQDCPVCKCDCEIKEGQIDLLLDTVEVLKKEDSGMVQKLNFFYQGEEFDKLESVALSFKPRCSGETTPLVVKIGSKTIFDQETFCQEEHKINIDTVYTDVGRNTLSFTSESKEEYLLTNIKIESEFSDNTNTTDNLFDIEFKVEEEKEVAVEEFADVKIVNYVEYDFNVEEGELEQEYLLKFDANEREGKIIVIVNDEEVFRGDVKKTNNEIPLSSNYLAEGDNDIKIMGIAE